MRLAIQRARGAPQGGAASRPPTWWSADWRTAGLVIGSGPGQHPWLWAARPARAGPGWAGRLYEQAGAL